MSASSAEVERNNAGQLQTCLAESKYIKKEVNRMKRRATKTIDLSSIGGPEFIQDIMYNLDVKS